MPGREFGFYDIFPGKMMGRKGICVVYHSKEETNIDMIDSNIYNKTSVKWYDHNIIWTKKRKGSKEISIFTMTQFYIISQESLVTSADYISWTLSSHGNQNEKCFIVISF